MESIIPKTAFCILLTPLLIPSWWIFVQSQQWRQWNNIYKSCSSVFIDSFEQSFTNEEIKCFQQYSRSSGFNNIHAQGNIKRAWRINTRLLSKKANDINRMKRGGLPTRFVFDNKSLNQAKSSWANWFPFLSKLISQNVWLLRVLLIHYIVLY